MCQNWGGLMGRISVLYIFLAIGILLPGISNAQTVPSVNFSGFIKTDAYLDTRNMVSAREGQFALFPMPPSVGEDGNDVNENTQFNMVSIQTRLLASITGPDAFGARTSGLVEAAFFGVTDANINTLRLRHALLRLDWDHTQLMVGQFWHPMFVTQSFPNVVSFNTGVPFQPFSRNPQVRLTHNIEALTFMIAALSQRDFTGIGGSASLRNSAIPNLHGQMQFHSGAFRTGAGVDFKRVDISPAELEPVNSFAYFGFVSYGFAGSGALRIYGVYGENMTDHLMLGGVAARDTPNASNRFDTRPTRLYSLWTELSSGFRGDAEGVRYEIALFSGYSKNLGINESANFTPLPGSRGLILSSQNQSIDNVWRIAPRFQVQSGNVRFSLELEYTAAGYGILNPDLTTTKNTTVGNFRTLFGAYLFF
ncbi:MAG: hypothetical protein LAT67_12115 [Balneolales bacterium]|nr:hypothetical protein [Balneolales bacterium]